MEFIEKEKDLIKNDKKYQVTNNSKPDTKKLEEKELKKGNTYRIEFVFLNRFGNRKELEAKEMAQKIKKLEEEYPIEVKQVYYSGNTQMIADIYVLKKREQKNVNTSVSGTLVVKVLATALLGYFGYRLIDIQIDYVENITKSSQEEVINFIKKYTEPIMGVVVVGGLLLIWKKGK